MNAIKEKCIINCKKTLGCMFFLFIFTDSKLRGWKQSGFYTNPLTNN